MKTQTEVEVNSIISIAINEALQYLKKKYDSRHLYVRLNSTNEKQSWFLENCYSLNHSLNQMFSQKELEVKTTETAEEINQWFESRGFDIKLMPGGEFYVGSILEIITDWLEKGKPTTLSSKENQTHYKAFTLQNNQSFSNVSCLGIPMPKIINNHNSQNHELVRAFKTWSKDHRDTFFFIENHPCFENLSLGQMARNLEIYLSQNNHHIQHPDGYVKNLTIPYINLDVKPDVSWMIGLEFSDIHSVQQAAQQVKFKMNELGTETKAAFGFGITGSVGFPPSKVFDYTFDKPFYMFIARQQLNQFNQQNSPNSFNKTNEAHFLTDIWFSARLDFDSFVEEKETTMVSSEVPNEALSYKSMLMKM